MNIVLRCDVPHGGAHARVRTFLNHKLSGVLYLSEAEAREYCTLMLRGGAVTLGSDVTVEGITIDPDAL